jgi:hypothetical protein
MVYERGTSFKLKKTHACGQNRWELLSCGEIISLRCLRCGHIISITEEKLKKNIKQVILKDGKEQ